MTWQTDLYDNMLEDVYSLTNRPDLTAETALALRAATTNVHLTDAYFRDVATSVVQLPNGTNQWGIDIPTVLPNFRGCGQVRPTDINQNLVVLAPEHRIEVVELGDIYDDYGSLRTKIAYASGSTLVVRSPINSYGLAIEWFQAPNTRRTEYNSWIAQMVPTPIILWAAALVLSTNGNDEKARNFLLQVEKFYIPQLKQNFLLGVMR